MGKWSRNKVNSANLNNGNEYEAKDRVSRQQLNAMVNSGLYSQDFAEHLADTPDVSEANNVGTPTVEMIDNVVGDKTYKKFKFKNLKGSTGEKGEKGEKGDTGSIGLTPNISVSASTLPTGSTATANRSGTNENPTIAFGIPKGETGKGYNPKGDWQSGIVYSNTDTDIDTVYYDGSTYYCKQTHTSSDSILPTNTTYWGLLSSVNILDPNYDTVIRTQSEFDTWVASVNAGTYLGKSVLIFGMGTPYILNVDASTKKGIDLSNLGLTITGISNAEITIYIPTINDSTATVWGIYNSGSSGGTVGGLPKATYSTLSNLNIRIYKQTNASLTLENVYAVYKCNGDNIKILISLSSETNVANCIGIENPKFLNHSYIRIYGYSDGCCVNYGNNLINCESHIEFTNAPSTASYNCVYYNCTGVVGCSAQISSKFAYTSGYRQCERVINCTADIATSSTISGTTHGIGFWGCQGILNCFVESGKDLGPEFMQCTFDSLLTSKFGKFDLLFSGSLTSSQTTTIPTAPQYDFLMCCWDAWGNTGGIFFVPTTKIAPVVHTDGTKKFTFGSAAAGSNGTVRGTSAFIKLNLENTTGLCEIYGGYDNTQEANQSFLRRIYGITLSKR